MNDQTHVPRTQSSLTKQRYLFALAILLLAGAAKGQSLQQYIYYVILTVAATLPGLLWIRQGALGLPILPTVALIYFPYYAWPLLTANSSTLPYDISEVAAAARTIVLFLLTATAAWRAFSRHHRGTGILAATPASHGPVIKFIILALGVGLAFNIAGAGGALGWLGSFFGVARSLVMTSLAISFFLLGMLRGQRLLHGTAWLTAVALAFAILILSLSTLFLWVCMLYLMASILGFTLARRRVPWRLILAALILFPILHAGKSELRARYWGEQSTEESIALRDVPFLMGEWIVIGAKTIVSPQRRTGIQSLSERMSLLRILLMAQRATPQYIDFLKGETYALLPAMATPRFINPEKPVSQAAMILLNVRFGVQTEAAAAATAIGWGLIAEAWANFGYTGILFAAVLLGSFCALLERWSLGCDILSIPALVSIACLLVLVNLELDFCNMAMALMQSSTSVILFAVFYDKFLVRRRKAR